MKLKQGKIDILFEHDGLVIRLMDDLAGVTFAEAKLNQEQVCQALSRLSHTHCEIEVRGLQKVGKKMMHKSLEFKMPKGFKPYDRNREETAIKQMNKNMPDGWCGSCYFGRRGSFFKKDGEEWARTHIYKWIEIET